MAQFGSLVSEHRERLGLSSSRVAELVGRSAGTIRSWERGRSQPDDPVVVSSLAAVLGIDETRLFVAAGMEPPAPSVPFSLEETLSTIAPSASFNETEIVVPVESDVDLSGRHARSSDETRLDDRDTPLDKLRTLFESFADDVRSTRLEANVAGSQRTNTARTETSRPVRRLGTQRKPATNLSYMEDVEQRWSYRARALLTAGGVGLLGIVLLWAGSQLLGAVGDVWDALTAGL